MKLQTKIPLNKQAHNQIDYQSKLFLIGSCFVENIGEKLDYFKFQTLQNPLGILFHPQAVEQLIINGINEKVYTDEDVFFQNEQWHCFESHSKLSASSKTALLNQLNDQIKVLNKHLKEATHIIITLGTAWVYRFIELDKVVANCHKVPQKKFLKELLSVDDISETLQSIEELIRSVNETASIIVTVSPVRHLKDGFVENTQSKAHLLAAIHSLLPPRAQSRGFCYFPSYEIMLDELRDYRFYTEDMIHPNQTAINYIWEKFEEVWISETALITMADVDIIQKSIQHKPFNPNSEAHNLFLKKLTERIKKLQFDFPQITF